MEQETMDLPTTPEQLLERFDNLSIPYELHHHDAVFTVKESLSLDLTIDGTSCRNMFVRDKKGKMFLISLANETKVDLRKLQDVLGCGRLSFGSPNRLWQYLGVMPGSVCPFSIINDHEKFVTLILDKWMMGQNRVNFHPLLNVMTVGMSPDSLMKFIKYIDHPNQVVDLSVAAPDI